MNETREQKYARILRRRHVKDLFASGHTIDEISKALNAAEHVVRRDIAALRRESAKRRPWGDPLSCAASFIEAAEDSLQKVRAAQGEAEPTSTAYVNLVKLEWAMLIKFIEMTAGRQPRVNENREDNHDAENLSNCSTEELIRRGKELGINLDSLVQRGGIADSACGENLEDAA